MNKIIIDTDYNIELIEDLYLDIRNNTNINLKVKVKEPIKIIILNKNNNVSINLSMFDDTNVIINSLGINVIILLGDSDE